MAENQSESPQNGNRNLIISAIVIVVLLIIGVVAVIIWMGGTDQEGAVVPTPTEIACICS